MQDVLTLNAVSGTNLCAYASTQKGGKWYIHGVLTIPKNKKIDAGEFKVRVYRTIGDGKKGHEIITWEKLGQ